MGTIRRKGSTFSLPREDFENPQRPDVHQEKPMRKLTTEWVVGFTDGEGCFTISINSQPKLTLKYQVQCEFVITQHKNDLQLLHALKDFFEAGTVQEGAKTNVAYYRVRSLEDLYTKILPFFEKHLLKTRKQLDYLRFRDAVRRLQSLRENQVPRTNEDLKFFCDLGLRRNARSKTPKAAETLLAIRKSLERT